MGLLSKEKYRRHLNFKRRTEQIKNRMMKYDVLIKFEFGEVLQVEKRNLRNPGPAELYQNSLSFSFEFSAVCYC